MNTSARIDKKKVARSFSRGKETYDKSALIQRKVSAKLIDIFSSFPAVATNDVLEIGCCTGTLTEMLMNIRQVKRLYLNDLVPSFYEDVAIRIAGSPGFAELELIPCFGDIEEIGMPEDLDLVISSSTFQWLTDLPRLFERLAGSLTSDGVLLFSIFGPGTLYEFKELTNIGLRYASVGNIMDMLDPHFEVEFEHTVRDQLFFNTPREVLRHLQATGVGGVQEYRWTPNRLLAFEKEYGDRFGTSSGIPVTYVSSYVVASKRKSS